MRLTSASAVDSLITRQEELFSLRGGAVPTVVRYRLRACWFTFCGSLGAKTAAIETPHERQTETYQACDRRFATTRIHIRMKLNFC